MEYNISIKNKYEDLSIYEYNSVTEILLSESELFNKEIEVVRLLVEPKYRDNIEDIPYTELSKLIAHTEFLQHPIKPVGIKPTYKIAGREFDMVIHPTKITTAQFVDLINITKDASTIMESLDKITAIFLIPKGKTYNEGYDLSELITFIGENCPITIAKEIGFFFANAQTVLRILSERYLLKSAKKILKKKDIPKNLRETLERQVSQLSGDGCSS